MLDLILEKDQEIFLFLNSLGNPNWDLFWTTITNKKTWIPLYVFLLVLSYRKENNKLRTLALGLTAALLIGLNDGLSNLFKDGFARLRPCNVPEIQARESFRLIKDYCGTYGYFSAHAANHFAVAIFMGTYFKTTYKFLFPLLLIWASFIAYSRIYIGVHYPLDVLTGTLIGYLSSSLFIGKLYPFLVDKISVLKG